MKITPPSHQPEYRKAYRLAKRLADPDEHRRKKREYHERVKDHRNRKLRERYKNDPEYREAMKRRSREFYKVPEKIEIGKAHRKAAYWKDPERFRRETREWQIKNREKYLQRNAERRAKNREQNRALARREAMMLTDSYVRNQLSKYSTKSTKEWTDVEVSAKRAQIVRSREKRVTMDKARQMRALYANGATISVIADQFGISVSMVFGIIANKWHHDPEYVTSRVRNFGQVSRVFRLLAAGATLKK